MHPACFFGIARCFVVAAALAVPSFATAQIPTVDPVPEGLRPIIRIPLEIERSLLLEERRSVIAMGKTHNGRCESVRSGSPNEQACVTSRDIFLAELGGFSVHVQRYREELKAGLAKEKALVEAPAAASAKVGIGIITSSDVQIVMPDGTILPAQSLSSGSRVIVQLGSRILTGPAGQLKIMLPDETLFTLGPNADLEFDDFVYDPDITAKKIAVSFTKGIFRYVTSKVARNRAGDSINVKLKVIAIGTRGTEVEISVDREGKGYVKLIDGKAVVKPSNSDRVVILTPGQMLLFDKTGIITEPAGVS